MDRVTVDENQCNRLVAFLRGVPLPPDGEEPKVVEVEADVLKNLYFVVVAICHQTTSPNGRNLEGLVCGKNLRGWDYLNARFQIAVKKDASLVSPMRLSTITGEDLEEIFHDDNGQTTIPDSEGRALLLQDIGRKMLDLGFDTVEKLYEKSGGLLVSEDNTGLLQQLSAFKAYSDPLMKKSFFFLALMKNHSLWSFSDVENLGPPVDYHEMRGHLRLGTVKIMDKRLLEQLLENAEISQEEDVLIRKAVYNAIMYIAHETSISTGTLHYFFWNLFRSCCTREEPHCNTCPATCALPVRYAKLKQLLTVNRCLLSDICESRDAKRKLTEPRFETEYY